MSIFDGRWWDRPWNPIHVKGGGWHCTKISPGCKNCWTETINIRFGNKLSFDLQGKFIPPYCWDINRKTLEVPLHWRKPQVIAGQWLGDLFHEQIPSEFIDKVFAVMALSPEHKFLVLTKRSKRMAEWFDDDAYDAVSATMQYPDFLPPNGRSYPRLCGWPLSNVWLGISISTQKEADEKIPLLLQTPSAHRYINFEPLLEKIDFRCPTCRGTGFYGDNGPGKRGNREYVACEVCHNQKPDWVLLGCESSPGRRPMRLEWARSIAEQCKAAGLPLWIKQIELEDWANSVYKAKTKVSKDMNEWDKDLRLRQWPW